MPAQQNFQIKCCILTHYLINVQLKNDQNRLRLAGVVYYGQHHFTAQIILSDGQIWFYDGIDTGRNLIYNGSINSNPPSLSHCRGKQSNGPQTSLLHRFITRGVIILASNPDQLLWRPKRKKVIHRCSHTAQSLLKGEK
jgi:hypothetical protein